MHLSYKNELRVLVGKVVLRYTFAQSYWNIFVLFFSFVLGSFLSNSVAAASDDDRWSKEFFSPDLTGLIRVITQSPEGDLIIGGSFSEIAGVPGTSAIARWDGQQWLGMGGDGAVSSILFVDHRMYVAGSFSTIGGVAATNVAMWDGTNWFALGGGVVYKTPGVYPARALAFYNGQLIAGGSFTNAGGVPTRGIARWDGTNWHDVGGGVTGGTSFSPASIDTLLANGPNLYAGGFFTNAGGVTATNVAVWDGFSWRALGHGAGKNRNESVSVLTKYGDDIIAGGSFTTAGGVPASLVAKWDGEQWSPLGGGLFPMSIGLGVDALGVVNGDLYAGGAIGPASVTSSRIEGLARWDGTNWHPVTPFIGGWVRAVGHARGSIYASGKLYTIGPSSDPSSLDLGLLRSDGTNWAGIGKGLAGNSTIRAFCSTGGRLMAGGVFTYYQQGFRESVAQFDGNLWSRIGSGIPTLNAFGRPAYAFASDRDVLYVSGEFGTAHLEGTNWVTMGPPAFALKTRGGELYAGHGGGISRWDGTSWSLLASNLSGNVHAIALVGPDIYAGGSFTNLPAVNSPASYIARWDGTNWWSVGSGVNGPVLSLLPSGNDMFVGGMFTEAGGIPAKRIARWNGQRWDRMGEGFSDGAHKVETNDQLTVISALARSPAGAVFAAGNFTRTGTNQANFIARWDETQWVPLGTGLDSRAHALQVHRNFLYAGGDFTVAGGSPSLKVAQWQLNESGLHITQIAPRLARPGDTITYQCVVVNYGQGSISNSIVRADVPQGTEFVSVADGGTREGNTLRWQIDALPLDREVQVSFTVRVTASSGVLIGKNYSIEWNGEVFRGEPVYTSVQPRPPGTPVLETFKQAVGQPFRIRVQGDSGMTYVIDASTNLLDWTSISTNTVGVNWQDFIDSDTNSFPQRFYRVRTQQ